MNQTNSSYTIAIGLKRVCFAVGVLIAISVFLISSDKAEAASTFPVYRMYNRYTQEHLFTRVKAEYDRNAKIGWIKEGIAWYSASSGEPVYRLLNLKSKDHHYTKDKHEIDVLVKKYGWKVEGTVFYSGGSIKVYRAFNSSLSKGGHHFTANKPEYDTLNSKWRREGVAFYAVKGGDLYCHNLEQKYPGYYLVQYEFKKDCGSYYDCDAIVIYSGSGKSCTTRIRIRKDCQTYLVRKGGRIEKMQFQKAMSIFGWSSDMGQISNGYHPYTRYNRATTYDSNGCITSFVYDYSP